MMVSLRGFHCSRVLSQPFWARSAAAARHSMVWCICAYTYVPPCWQPMLLLVCGCRSCSACQLWVSWGCGHTCHSCYLPFSSKACKTCDARDVWYDSVPGVRYIPPLLAGMPPQLSPAGAALGVVEVVGLCAGLHKGVLWAT